MKRLGILAVLLLALAVALPAPAQQEETAEGPPPKKEKPLGWREADQLLRQNDDYLRAARRAREYNDTEQLKDSLAKYGKNMDRIHRAIGQNNLDERDTDDILETVDNATARHQEALTGLLDRVPEQARPAIQRALQASQRGRQAAQAAIARRGGQPAGAGKPEGAGKPGSAGPPAGQGGPPGGKPPGGPPGGKPK